MTKNFLLFLEELKHLKLLEGKYAIFGSGPLAIRNIRDTNDIDIIVKDDVYAELSEKYSDKIVTEPVNRIQLGNLEIGNTWLNEKGDIDKMIDTADIIEGFPFVKMEYIVKWKKKMGREKDLKDLGLIEEYLNKK